MLRPQGSPPAALPWGVCAAVTRRPRPQQRGRRRGVVPLLLPGGQGARVSRGKEPAPASPQLQPRAPHRPGALRQRPDPARGAAARGLARGLARGGRAQRPPRGPQPGPAQTSPRTCFAPSPAATCHLRPPAAGSLPACPGQWEPEARGSPGVVVLSPSTRHFRQKRVAFIGTRRGLGWILKSVRRVGGVRTPGPGPNARVSLGAGPGAPGGRIVSVPALFRTPSALGGAILGARRGGHFVLRKRWRPGVRSLAPASGSGSPLPSPSQPRPSSARPVQHVLEVAGPENNAFGACSLFSSCFHFFFSFKQTWGSHVKRLAALKSLDEHEPVAVQASPPAFAARPPARPRVGNGSFGSQDPGAWAVKCRVLMPWLTI